MDQPKRRSVQYIFRWGGNSIIEHFQNIFPLLWTT